ncbi:hypothetical protein Fmac_017479 [Flemingia macrophylla]|uniref:U1-type domain-containing protein n=1 Tax=Flemingia macrophylla TaxID=520843 RepID=A0ABD1M2X1_9FABA
MEHYNWPDSLQTEIPIPCYPQPSSLSPYPLPPPVTIHSHLQNPKSQPSPPLNPPGVDFNPATHVDHASLPYPQTHVVADSNSLATAPAYYLVQDLAARDAVRQYGADPAVYAPCGNMLVEVLCKIDMLLVMIALLSFVHGLWNPYYIEKSPIRDSSAKVKCAMPVRSEYSRSEVPGIIPMPSNGSQQLVMPNANTNYTFQTNTTTQPLGDGTGKKHLKKAKTKIVQPAYCEVCKIECTSKEVLDQHKLGKKHKKNLDKLRESLAATQVQPSNPIIGPQLPNDKNKSTSGNKSKRKTVETAEDLQKKKKRVIDCGAAVEALKICTTCNVVCNSETVYNFHLAGQKHAAMMKKASQSGAC